METLIQMILLFETVVNWVVSVTVWLAIPASIIYLVRWWFFQPHTYTWREAFKHALDSEPSDTWPHHTDEPVFPALVAPAVRLAPNLGVDPDQSIIPQSWRNWVHDWVGKVADAHARLEGWKPRGQD